MQKSTLLAIIAAIAMFFGVALAVAPQTVLSWFGGETDGAGQYALRMLGAALGGKAIIFYSIRHLEPSAGKSGAYWGGLATASAFTVFSVIAVNDEALGAVGWSLVVLGFVMILAFSFLIFGPGAKPADTDIHEPQF